MADQYAGEGGSYRVTPDGDRVLMFRTGLGDVTPPAKKSKAKPAEPMTTTAEEGQQSDG
jgi:hypothetical protein